MQKFKYFWAFIVVVGIQTSPVLADRLKDLTSLAGVRSNQLVGYGVLLGWLERVMGILVSLFSQCSP